MDDDRAGIIESKFYLKNKFKFRKKITLFKFYFFFKPINDKILYWS